MPKTEEDILDRFYPSVIIIKNNDKKYLDEVTDFIKLNYNCPDSEKQGTGPGSCGGSVDKESKPSSNDIWLSKIGKLPEDEPGYFYHTTTKDVLDSIKSRGLVGNQKEHNFSSNVNPNTQLTFLSASIEDKEETENNPRSVGVSYWSKMLFEKNKKDPVILRVKKENVSGVKEFGKGYEFRTKDKIDPKNLQYWSGNKWHDLSDLKKQDSAYLADAFETIKLNYKCKAGTVDDSNKCGLEQENTKNSNFRLPTSDIDRLITAQRTNFGHSFIDTSTKSGPSNLGYDESTPILENLIRDNNLDIAVLKQYNDLSKLYSWGDGQDAVRDKVRDAIVNNNDLGKFILAKSELEEYAYKKYIDNIPLLAEKQYNEDLDQLSSEIEVQKFVDNKTITKWDTILDRKVTEKVPLYFRDMSFDTIEEAKSYINKLKEQNSKIPSLYRKGKYHSSFLESYTPSEEGTGQFKNPNIKLTEDTRIQEGWRIFSGIIGVIGEPDEHEITLININDIKQRQDSAYLADAFETIKLNYNCPDSEKNGSGPGSCGGNTDSKIDINPEIAPADYNSFFENFNKISKDKSEPDRIMRRLNAETVQRRFYRKTEEHFNEIKLENDKKLKEKDEKLWDNLRPEVQSAIKSYTTQDYGVINSALQDSITREEVSLLKEATSKPLGVSTILYRGINFKMPKDIFKVGATWIHKPFASCSTGSFIAEEAASGKLTHITPEEKTILQIFTEPETKGFAVGKNSFHAGADAGSEVILDAGTKFQTIHSEKRGGMRILTVRAINDEQKQDSSYLEDVTNFIKLNYKCPKGTVDDSNKCNPEEQEKSNTSDSKSASETFIGFKADHDFSSPQDIEANKQIQASLNKAAEPLKKFKPEDRRILRQYSVNSYVDVHQYLNGTLEKEVDQDSSILRHAKEDVVALDKLFSEANLQEPLVTYRGLKDDIIVKNPELRDALDTPGSEIEFPCFSSTSALPFMANNFAEGYNGRLLELQLPTGTKALFIAEESGIPNEFEILVNRGTKFKVVETRYTNIIPPNNGSYKDKSAKHVKITTIKAIV